MVDGACSCPVPPSGRACCATSEAALEVAAVEEEAELKPATLGAVAGAAAGTPAEVPVYLWNPLPAPVSATLRLICFNHLPTDRLAVALNGHVLTPAHIDGALKDPEIHSPAPQPPSVTPFTLLKDVGKQSLTRIDFTVPADALRHGVNIVSVSVAGRGAFRTGSYIQVEKTELHLR